MALTQTPEEGLKVSNAPSNGQFLKYKDGTDKLTWTDIGTYHAQFNDEIEVRLGGESDLRIYHQAGSPGLNHLYSANAGTTVTCINNDFKVQYGTSNANLINCDGTTDKNVELYFAGNKKFETTTGGVGVTGAVSSLGATDLTLNTNAGTDSGSIVITDAANGDITITPNGTGDVVLDGLKYPQADGSAGQFLKTDGSAQLSWATVSSTPEGEAIQSTTNSNEASTKFLRADGDGTCSWQIPPAATTTSGTDNFTVADGNLVIGTAGHGIDFSATPNHGTNNSPSEILDDYEEGEWEPALYAGYDGSIPTNYSSYYSRYTKIGRCVHINTHVRIDDADTNNNLRFALSSFPFGFQSAAHPGLTLHFYYTNSQTVNPFMSAAGYVYWQNTTVGGNNLGENTSWMDDVVYMHMTGTYLTTVDGGSV